MHVAFSEHSQVPGGLQVANVLWILFSISLGAFLLFVSLRHDLVEKYCNARWKHLLCEKETRKLRVVFVTLLQPFNCLWFYRWAGFPGLVEGTCVYYQNFDGVLKRSSPGETYPPRQWMITDVTEIPAQPHCESVINVIFEGSMGLSGDRWDEIYEFGIRVFGFCAGAIIDRSSTASNMDFTAALIALSSR